MHIIQPQLSDIEAILAIQRQCYPEPLNEGAAAFLAKLQAAPKNCFIAKDKDQVLGYLISLPWSLDKPLPLDSKLVELKEDINCLYIHDLALDINARSTGSGRALIEKALSTAREQGLKSVALVAVQGAETYWQKQGFKVKANAAELAEFLTQYGTDAVYMTRDLE